MAVIHEATEDDAGPLLELAWRFLLESDREEFQVERSDTPDETFARLSRLYAQILEHGLLLAARVDGRYVGFLAAVVLPHPFTGRPYADIIAWHVSPTARRTLAGPQLLGAFVDWATRKRLTLIKMAGPVTPRAARFFRSQRFEPVEVTFVRFL